jgi:hypothetical protein
MFERTVKRPTRRSRSVLLLVGLAGLLAACGGGNGGGGGGGDGTAATLHALVVNASEGDAAVTYTDADGTPTEEVMETCTARVLNFPITDPFQLAVDGTVVLDTATLPEGLPGAGESDLVVKVEIDRDGVAEFDNVRAGRSISIPARSAYCATLPG